MQKNSDLDVRRHAARMGAALPAYRSFRNSPVWSLPAPLAEIPPSPDQSGPADMGAAAAEMPPATPEAAREAAALPAAMANGGIAALRTLLTAPAPDAPPPAMRHAPPAGNFPLIEAALAARPAAAPPAGPTLAALRDRLAGTSQPMGR